MKKTISTFFLLVFITHIGYSNALLKRTTSIPVRLNEDLSSKEQKSAGFFVDKDIKDSNGKIVIPEGTEVLADVNLKKKKSVGKSGEILINLISVEDVNGNIIKLNGKYEVSPKDIKGKVLGVGLGVGLFLLFPMLLYLIPNPNQN